MMKLQNTLMYQHNGWLEQAWFQILHQCAKTLQICLFCTFFILKSKTGLYMVYRCSYLVFFRFFLVQIWVFRYKQFQFPKKTRSFDKSLEEQIASFGNAVNLIQFPNIDYFQIILGKQNLAQISFFQFQHYIAKKIYAIRFFSI